MPEVKMRLKDGNLMIAGEVNERLPAVTNGLVAHFPFDGTEKGISNRNLVNYSGWVIGSTGSQPGFSQNGDGNSIMEDIDPFGKPIPVWRAFNNDLTSDADGGFLSDFFNIDRTKMYRFSMWIKRHTLGNGSYYFGLQGWAGSTHTGVLNRSNGTVNTNPYFRLSNGNGILGDWFLLVGHVWPTGSGTGAYHQDSGVYNRAGQKIASMSNDFVWNTDTTRARNRSYLYYSTDPLTDQRWCHPRVDLCDGTEPTIQDLIRGEGNIYNYPLMNRREPVQWTGGVNVEISDNTIRKTTTTSTWDAGARSIQVFNSGNVFVEWRVSCVDSTHSAEMVGLTADNTTASFEDIDFAIYTNNNGSIYVYENGANKGAVSAWDKTTNNVFKVAVENGVVRYYQNNNLIYTSAVAPTYPLFVDCSMHSHGGFNSIIDAHVGINNLCTITDDGIAIEEAVTNIIPTSRRLFEGWTQYQSCVATVTQGQHVPEWNTHQATRIQTVGGTNTLKYYISVVSPSVSGQAYTSQCRIKNIGRNPVVFETQLRGTATVQPGETTLAVCSVTGNGTSNLQLRFQTTVVGHNLDILVFQPQVETRAFPTSFVDGARISPGRLSIPTPINLQQSFTIGAWTKVNKTDGYRMICGDWGTFYFSWYIANNRIVLSWIDGTQKSLGSGAMSGVDCRNWNYVSFSYNPATTTAKIYCNGILRASLNTVNFTDAPDGILAIGDINNDSDNYKLNGIVKDFSIYNRVLTDEEHMKLARNNMSLRPNGDIIVPNLTCKPLIPVNAIYFPLGVDGKDISHVINPASEVNISYRGGAAWVGSSTSNLTSSGITFYTGYHTGVFDGKTVTMVMKNSSQFFVLCPTNLTPYQKTLAVSGYIRKNGKPYVFNPSVLSTYQNSADLRYKYYDEATGFFECVQYYANSSSWLFHCSTGGSVEGDIFTITDFQVEEKSFNTPYCLSTRGDSSLYYTPSTFGLDLNNSNWTVCGFIKPIPSLLASTGTRYNPLEIGNYYTVGTTSITMFHESYANDFNGIIYDGQTGRTAPGRLNLTATDMADWILIGFRLEGTTLSMFAVGISKGFTKTTSTKNWTTPIADRIYLGGYRWAAGNFFVRDFMMIPSALTDAQLEAIYRTQMRQKDGLRIKGTIIEGKVL